MKIHMVPAHEAIARELSEDPSVTVRVDEAIADGSLPPCYHQTPTTTPEEGQRRRLQSGVVVAYEITSEDAAAAEPILGWSVIWVEAAWSVIRGER